MPLTTIWIIRHAFRGSWDQNPHTGKITARFPTPTGLPADPPLTAYGETQARELASLASEFDPPVVRIYSSPYYRCLQTIGPFARRLPDVPLIIDPGLGEWFGTAPWEQPKPAPFEELSSIFPDLNIRPFWAPHRNEAEMMEMLQEYQDQLRHLEQQNRYRIKKASHKRTSTTVSRSKKHPDIALKEYQKQLENFEKQSRRRAEDVENVEYPLSAPPHSILPAPWGESSTTLHDRVAYALDRIVDTNDRMLASDPEPRSIVITSHAAPIIAMGRALTGNMPDDIAERDFCTNCAGVTKFERREGWEDRRAASAPAWEEGDETPALDWRTGKGVGGGWKCTQNSDARHLSGGGDRDWHFSGEESFLPVPDSRRTRSDPGVPDTDAAIKSEHSDKSKL